MKPLVLHISNAFRLGSVVLFSVFLTACAASRLSLNRVYKKMSKEEKLITDSILNYALDHEALYTLVDTLKPMSSIKMYRLPLLSANPMQVDSASNALITLQVVANKLSKGDFQFILNPFERADSIYKNIELYVVRKSKVATTIAQHSSFYNTLGIANHSDPATVLAITEYESKYNRWRSYGYLFGYPDHAVDFFVSAGKEQDSTRQFVQRDFFQIPVYAGATGYFTYAVPKGYEASKTDSAIYMKANETLFKYKAYRTKKAASFPFKYWVRNRH